MTATVDWCARIILWTLLAGVVGWLTYDRFGQPALVSPRISALVTEHSKRGAEHFRRLEWEPAAEEFEEAVHLDPTSLPAWLNLGFSQIEVGAYDEAFRSLCTAIRLDPSVHVAYRGLGMVMVQAGVPALAPSFLSGAALLLDGSNDPQIRAIAGDEKAQIHRWMSEALMALDRPEEALEEAKEAFALRPSEKFVAFTYSRALHVAGRTLDAIQVMLKCIKLDPYFFSHVPRHARATGRLESYYLYLARLYIEANDIPNALGALSAAVQASRGPALADALRLTSLCYEKIGDMEQARRYAHEAGLPNPVQPSALTGPGPMPDRASEIGAPPTPDAGPVVPGPFHFPATTNVSMSAANPSLAFANPGSHRPALRLVDRTRAAGLALWSHDCGPSLIYNPEATGPGVAVMDFDGDGWMDIFVPTGAEIGPDGTMTRTNTNVLWRNNGDGTFTDVTAAAGLAGAGFGQGCVVADYDNDGYPDLLVTCYGQSQLFHNNGDGTFTDTAASARILGGRFATGAAFGDYDRDGWLDLYVGHYTGHDYAHPPPHKRLLTVEGDYVSPESLGPFVGEGEENHLYHNKADGTFEDRTRSAHVAKGTRRSKTLGVIWTDLDGDGWPDLLVGNDESQLFLYQNRHDGTFREVASQFWIADGRGNMGIDVGDIDNDGLLDVIITHWVHEETALYRGVGEHRFVDQALVAGLGKHDPITTGWGVALADVANVGHLDIVIANGLTSATHYDPANFDHTKNFYEPQGIELYRNVGSFRFEDASMESGLATLKKRSGRGVATADFDHDGGIDVIVANNNAPVYLLMNASPDRGHWLALDLVGTRSNRSAVGCKVRLTSGGITQLRETHAGISYLSSSSPLVHFGLGGTSTVERLEITWPSGERSVVDRPATDRIVRVVEPPSGGGGGRP